LRISSRSLVVTPGASPASTFASRFQRRNVSAAIPSFDATCLIAAYSDSEPGAVSCNRRTARCRNSTGYFEGIAPSSQKERN
jgi:hypothetical protein